MNVTATSNSRVGWPVPTASYRRLRYPWCRAANRGNYVSYLPGYLSDIR